MYNYLTAKSAKEKMLDGVTVKMSSSDFKRHVFLKNPKYGNKGELEFLHRIYNNKGGSKYKESQINIKDFMTTYKDNQFIDITELNFIMY